MSADFLARAKSMPTLSKPTLVIFDEGSPTNQQLRRFLASSLWRLCNPPPMARIIFGLHSRESLYSHWTRRHHECRFVGGMLAYRRRCPQVGRKA